MKIGIFLVLVLVSVYTLSSANAQTNDEKLGYRFLPSKLIENSEGIIQVFAENKDGSIPKELNRLTATSLDSSIIRVIEVQENIDGFVSEIKLKAVQPGKTKIFLAAHEFSSIAIDVTVHGNKLHQEQLLVKAIPTTFFEEGPQYGYVSVEIADETGFPVIANQPVVIRLSSSDSSVVHIPQRDLIIEKGEYFVESKFELLKAGEAKIYASSGNIATAKSETIVVSEKEEDLGIKLYLFPEKFNVYSTTKHFIIAQLVDEQDEPVIAKNDVTVNFLITNSNFTKASNISSNYNLFGNVKDQGFFTIKKGSYWGFSEFSTLAHIEDKYKIVISSKNPLGVDSKTFETMNVELFDDKIVKFEALPILATGNRELIGVAYLEDENGNPILAEKDLEVKIASSDFEFLDIEETVIPFGFGSALVYGYVGHSIPDDLQLHAEVEESTTLIEAEIFGPKKDTLTLRVEPLIPAVLADTDFPIIAYLQDENTITRKGAGSTNENINLKPAVEFPTSGELFASPNEYLLVESEQISRGDDIVKLKARSAKKGTETISFRINEYEKELKIESFSIQPSKLQLDHPKNMFSGRNDVFSVQLLDNKGNPVFANKDIEIQLVTKDNSIIEAPKTVSVKKGDYFTMFDVAAKTGGDTEISALAEELQLVSGKVKVTSLSPDLELQTPTLIEKDEAFDAILMVKANGKPLPNSEIEWTVNGGIVQISDMKTDSNGNGKISLIGIDESTVKITAMVKDSVYNSASISKNVSVNSTASEFMAFAEEDTPEQFEPLEVYGFDPVLILVPVGIGVAGFMLKKKGMLKIKN